MKQNVPMRAMKEVLSLPMRERGLKPRNRYDISCIPPSLPMRERGLKPVIADILELYQESLPMRERGLKLVIANGKLSSSRRSPCGSVD